MERDVEPFVVWRGGDPYKDDVVREELGERFAGERIVFVAEHNCELVGTVQFVPRHEDVDSG